MDPKKQFPEKQSTSSERIEVTSLKNVETELILDKHGLPLVPQPSSDPLDPLLYPRWMKILILLQVSWLACLGIMNHSIINPAYVPLAKEFDISTVTASYQTTVALVFAGFGPWLWVPLSRVYGRRPVYIWTWLFGIISAAGAGVASSFATLMVARAFMGLFTSAALAIGAAAVSDIFFLHERARAMGVFTVFMTNGAHITPIPGGYLAQFVGWRWTFYFIAILDGASLVFILLFLPETLYKRTEESAKTAERHLLPVPQLLKVKMRLWGHRPQGYALTWKAFSSQFIMFKYPSVLFPFVYYTVCFSFASILPALTAATLFHRIYEFTPSQIGLTGGLSTLIGTALGEVIAGPVLDRMVYRYRERHGGEAIAETNLHAIWPGAIILPSGLLNLGFCLEYRTHWIGPCMGIGVACFGLQGVSTVLYTYIAACYKPQTEDTAQIFNFGREVFGFTLGFWVIRFGDRTGYQYALLTLALITLVCFAPIVWLMRAGPRIRKRVGPPPYDWRRDQ